MGKRHSNRLKKYSPEIYFDSRLYYGNELEFSCVCLPDQISLVFFREVDCYSPQLSESRLQLAAFLLVWTGFWGK